MRRFIFLLLIMYNHLYAYKIVSPLPFSIINTDYIKFQVTQEENDPTTDSIYFILIGKKIGGTWDTINLKADDSNNYIFNCRALVDNKYFISAKVWYGGKYEWIGKEKNKKGTPFILDRNENLPEIQHFSSNGKLSSEFEKSFTCNNNQVFFNTSWDKDSLFIQIKVLDEHLIVQSIIDTIDNSFLRIWESDGLEISIDGSYNRSEFRQLDDSEFLISINGNSVGYRWADSIGTIHTWGNNNRLNIKIQGTVNNNSDIDTGYIINLHIPWNDLNLKPSVGLKIGFDIQNYDRDLEKDFAFRSSWSGVLRENNDNTSEWGTLILTEKKNYWGYVIAILFLLVLVYWYRVNKLKKRQKYLEQLVHERTTDLLTANNNLQKLNATKDKFFSIIAHDLKNPFQGILMSAELLLKEFNKLDDDDKILYVQTIEKASKSAFGLLENLLIWARSQTGKVSHCPSDVNLFNLVKETFELLQLNANTKNIALINRIPENTHIYVDKNSVTTIIRNLINNAIKFTPSQGSVILSAENQDGYVYIKVQDTGVGMPPEIASKLFRIDQHITTMGTSGEEGTGLGLIICHDFVLMNKGSISVESTTGEGTIFTIKLPAYE